jgi:hypothetical protein
VATTSEEMRGVWHVNYSLCRLCRQHIYHTYQEHKLAIREESHEG